MLFKCKQQCSFLCITTATYLFLFNSSPLQNDISNVGAIKVNISAQTNVLKSFCDYGSEFPDTQI
jgi:hypothetical protein